MALCIITLIGCTPEQEQQGKKEIRDGITYMENTKAGLWDNSKKMILEPVLTIGVEDGEEN